MQITPVSDSFRVSFKIPDMHSCHIYNVYGNSINIKQTSVTLVFYFLDKFTFRHIFKIVLPGFFFSRQSKFILNEFQDKRKDNFP